jgi:hypothetical protein
MSSRARKALDDELQKVEFETSEEVDVVPTFDSMGIREDLLRGIYAYGFEKPSAIQQRAIKQIIKVLVVLFHVFSFFIFRAATSSLKPSLVPVRLLLSPSQPSRSSTPPSERPKRSSSARLENWRSKSRKSSSLLAII